MSMKYLALNDYENHRYLPDLDIASLLIAKSYELVFIDKISDNKATFVFKNAKEMDDLIEGYWQDTVKVSPLKFTNARRSLKARLYAMKTPLR